MMNFNKAVQFVRDHGNELEKARLDYILTNQRPSAEIAAKLFTGQRPDGGWCPFWASDYSSLDATCFRLAQAEQLGIEGGEPAVQSALDFLVRRQFSDGSWEEDASVAESAPPWAKPGDLSARLYLTSNCALWLALFGNLEESASRAAEYLKGYLDPAGHLPSFFHTHWLASGLWHKLDWQEPRERVFKYLDSRINDLATSNLSWLITTLCAAGVPTAHYLVVRAASLLEQAQQVDGSWQSEDGSNQNVHSTLEAMRALSLCGRVVK